MDYIGYTNGRRNKSLISGGAGGSGGSGSGDTTTNEQFGESLGGENKYWAVALILFPILTIFGNSLVVMSVIREKNLHTVTNYFVVSLAIADLTVAAAVMPIAVFYEVVQTLHFLKKSFF